MLQELERSIGIKEKGDNNGGDFNARIGRKGGGVEVEEEWRKEKDEGRKSKNTKIKKGGC